jgi:hypothetical protein
VIKSELNARNSFIWLYQMKAGKIVDEQVKAKITPVSQATSGKAASFPE